MASRGEELLISANSHIIEDPHFWENRLPAALKEHAPVFPSGRSGGLFQAHAGGWGSPRAGEGDGGGWGEWRGALSKLRHEPFRTPGRLSAGGLLPRLQRLDPGVLLRGSRPPLRCVLYLRLRHRPRGGGAGALPEGQPAWGTGVAGTAAGVSLSPPTTTSAYGRRPRIWRCRSASTSLPDSPSLAAADGRQAADGRPSRPCAAPSTTNCSTPPTPWPT